MAKKIIKYFFVFLMIAVIGSLVVRIMLSNDKRTFQDFEVTDETRSEFHGNGKVLPRVLTLGLKDKISGRGYFCAYSLYCVEDTGEVQVTVRYNKSAVGYTGVENEDGFEFLLLLRDTPLTLIGEDKNEDEGVSDEDNNMFTLYDGVYYEPDSVETRSKYGLYRFKKLIFKDVRFSEDGISKDELAVVMIPTGLDIPASDSDALTRMSVYEKIFDDQTVHFASQPFEEHKLIESDIMG